MVYSEPSTSDHRQLLYGMLLLLSYYKTTGKGVNAAGIGIGVGRGNSSYFICIRIFANPNPCLNLCLLRKKFPHLSHPCSCCECPIDCLPCVPVFPSERRSYDKFRCFARYPSPSPSPSPYPSSQSNPALLDPMQKQAQKGGRQQGTRSTRVPVVVFISTPFS